MAIGVSYMGHDGRRADFTTEGNPTPGSALDQLVRGGTGGNPLTPLAEQMRRARRPQAPDPRVDKAAGTVLLSEADRRPGTLTEKMKRGGSVVASENGVCLKGEEQVTGNGVYAKHGEKQGFLTLDEIDDPNAKGGVVGEADSQNRLTPSNKTSSDKEGAFGVNMQSRTEAEVNEETGEVTFWEYTKRWDVTSGRRVGEVGGETKRKICSFFLGGGELQLTYGSWYSPLRAVRSHYVDKSGKTKYEYWVKCLKWFDASNEGWDNNRHHRTSGVVFPAVAGGSSTNSMTARGVYPNGVFGHYPRRPVDRPRKIVFDSGREAIVDFFEEVDCKGRYNDIANGWTYIGCSDDFPDGNATFFYSLLFYDYYDEDGEEHINEGDIRDVMSFVVTKEKYEVGEDLVNMLKSNGSVLVNARRNIRVSSYSLFNNEKIFFVACNIRNFNLVSDDVTYYNQLLLLFYQNAAGKINRRTYVRPGSTVRFDDKDYVIMNDKVFVERK